MKKHIFIISFLASLCGSSALAQNVNSPINCLGEPTLASQLPASNSNASDNLLWGIPRGKIDQCINQNNWPVALRQILTGISEWNYRKRDAELKIRQLGINTSPISQYLSGRNEQNLNSLYWSIRGPETLDRNLLRNLETVNGRRLSSDEQKLVSDYTLYCVAIERHLFAFARGLNEASRQMLSERWQILPAIEANRPTITPRTLTREEQNLARRLSAEYIQSASTRTSDRLAQMTILAQSGDRIAMIAVRDALAKGAPWDIASQYLSLSVDTSLLNMVSSVVSAQWTAHIWHLYGYEDAGRKSMSACVNGLYGVILNDREKGVTARLIGNTIMGANSAGMTLDQTSETCGFTLTGALSNEREGGLGNGRLISRLPRGATNITYYDTIGSTARASWNDFYITGVNFSPILGDAAAREQKFQNHLAARRNGLLFRSDGSQANFTTTLGISYAWYQQYATETGRLRNIEDADAYANSTIRRNIANENAQRLAQWNSALAKLNSEAPNPTKATIDELQRIASLLGVGYWNEYERLVPNRYGNAPIQNSTSVASGNQGTSNQRVEVRTYGAGGNYTGSMTTSAVWADIMKMSSGPPR